MGNYDNSLPKTSDRLSTFDRVRVDVAQTSFWEGREFRTFKELSIPALSTIVIKAVVPIDIILFSLQLSLDIGAIRMPTVVGGTEGGSFSSSLPIFGANNMAQPVNHRKTFGVSSDAFYVPQVLLSTGGTHTGGTELDVITLKTQGNSQQASSVGTGPTDERGVAPNTYYFRLQNTSNDVLAGKFSARWEERP
jgi:hypothetical protein